MAHGWRIGVVLTAGSLILGSAVASQATVGMLRQARIAGVKVEGCLDCHGSPHSKEEMEKQAREVGFPATNCLGCHGSKFPSKLNAAGDWLVAQKAVRGAKIVDGAWLRDYVPSEAKNKKR